MISLTCSAIYLAGQLEAFSSLSSYLQDGVSTNQSLSATSSDASPDFLPISMVAVTAQEDQIVQLGVQYNKTQGDLFFDATSQLLKEVLGNLGEPQPLSQEEFFSVVQSAPCLYFELFGELPLLLLEDWLSSSSQSTHTAKVTAMALGTWQDNLHFFYQEDKEFFHCPVSILDVTRLESVLSTLSGSPLIFTGQNPALTALSPLTLWGDQPEETLQYYSHSPLSQEESRREVLEVLDFQTSPNAQYLADDALVLRSNSNESLRLSFDGTILYHSEGTPRYRLPRNAQTITLSEQVEGCRQFVADLWSDFPLRPDIHLYSLETLENKVIVSLYFSLQGIPLVWNHDAIGAQFHLEGDVISEFTLRYRQYNPLERTTPTLPLPQVEAILTQQGSSQKRIFLGYQDQGGETMSAGWVIM